MDNNTEETPKAAAAYAVYRNLGALRSLKKAAAEFYDRAETGPEPYQVNQFKEWSKKYGWARRVAEHDAEMERENRLKRQADADEARERAVRGAHLLQSIGLKAMHEMNQGRLLADGNRVPEHNPNATILRYYREGVELEFLALGLPISVIRQQVEGPTPEDVEAQEMQENAKRAAAAFRGPRRGGQV